MDVREESASKRVKLEAEEAIDIEAEPSIVRTKTEADIDAMAGIDPMSTEIEVDPSIVRIVRTVGDVEPDLGDVEPVPSIVRRIVMTVGDVVRGPGDVELEFVRIVGNVELEPGAVEPEPVRTIGVEPRPVMCSICTERGAEQFPCENTRDEKHSACVLCLNTYVAQKLHSYVIRCPLVNCNNVMTNINGYLTESQFRERDSWISSIHQKRSADYMAELKTLVSPTLKLCPSCCVPIEKGHGCDHMTCSICQFRFFFPALSETRDTLPIRMQMLQDGPTIEDVD